MHKTNFASQLLEAELEVDLLHVSDHTVHLGPSTRPREKGIYEVTVVFQGTEVVHLKNS